MLRYFYVILHILLLFVNLYLIPLVFYANILYICLMVLHLTLYRKYFIEILNGRKKNEYRKANKYWDKRFMNKDKYIYVIFKNGYHKNSPQLTIEIKSITKLDNYYKISLGNIINTLNCPPSFFQEYTQNAMF